LKKSIQRYAIRLRLDVQGLPSLANPFAASLLTQDFFNHEKQKSVFCFSSFSNTWVFENGGTCYATLPCYARKPRVAIHGYPLAASQRARVPHRRVLKNSVFQHPAKLQSHSAQSRSVRYAHNAKLLCQFVRIVHATFC